MLYYYCLLHYYCIGPSMPSSSLLLLLLRAFGFGSLTVRDIPSLRVYYIVAVPPRPNFADACHFRRFRTVSSTPTSSSRLSFVLRSFQSVTVTSWFHNFSVSPRPHPAESTVRPTIFHHTTCISSFYSVSVYHCIT